LYPPWDNKESRWGLGLVMKYLLALIAAIVGGAVGAFVGFFIAALLAPMLGISSFEGAAGYFAVFIGGPLGALMGIILGVTLAMRWRGQTGAGATARGVGFALLGIAALGGLGLALAYWLMVDTVNPNGAPPQLVFEIKLPAGAMAPRDADRPIRLVAKGAKSAMPGTLRAEETREEGGRPVVGGFVELYERTSNRLLVMTMPDKTDMLFDVDLPGVPKHSREFSKWQHVKWIGEVGKEQPRKATAADQYEIRYRAEWVGQ
jgi:hypothetical protein